VDELHFCQRCNRRIRSPKAIADGMGKVCKQKDSDEKVAKDLDRLNGVSETDLKE
jgi:hypothetical protein